MKYKAVETQLKVY